MGSAAWVLVLMAGAAGGASAWQTVGPPLPEFDAASIKPHETEPLGMGMAGGPMTAARMDVVRTRIPGRVTFSIGKVDAENVTARQLIVQAYDLRADQVTGGPDWLDLDRFDLVAKAGTAAEDPQLRLMLRSLLTDRFRLAAHRETKDMRAYSLTIRKPGPQLTEWKEGYRFAPSQKKGVVGVYRGHGTMQQLAEVLAHDPLVDHPVVDRTGLSGVYVLRLEWKKYGTILSGLKALGLRVHTERQPVEVLVVDEVESPREN